MIETNFQQLRRKKALSEARDLTLRDIATEAGLSVSTVHKVSVGEIDGVKVATLDALCRYFAVSSISELIEFTDKK